MPPRARQSPSDVGERYFPAYRRIRNAVGWAKVSARHYDYVGRPLLVRLFAAALADRHGIDLRRSPGRARAVIGEESWPLLDPTRPARDDTSASGIDLATLTRVVQELEEL